MANKISPPYLTNLDLNSINDAIIDVYRHLNRISDSADEVTFVKTEDGSKKLVLNNHGKKYVEATDTVKFDSDTKAKKDEHKNKVKEKLSLDKITNESKSTMFTNPSFTGATTIATNIANETRIGSTNQADNHLVVYAPLDNSGMLVFRDSVYDRWAIGYRHASNNTLRINPSKTVASADVFSLTDAGNLSVDGTITSSNGVCSGDTIAWNSWEFNIFRATGNGTAASARRYYRDVDDTDDYRLWDAYFDNTTGSYVVSTANLAGLFVVPEACKIGAVYGQIAGDSSTENPTVEIWKVTPSDASGGTPVIMATDTITIGSADSNYEINPTSFTDNTLAAGDVVIPAVMHGNAGAVQSYYGNLTVKFVKQ